MVGNEKSKGKHMAKKRKEGHGDNLEFILTYFLHPPLRKLFHNKFMLRSVLAPYFVNLLNMEKLAIYDKSLSDFIIDMA